MNETLQFIHRYFNNELSPEEKLAFEKRCKTEPAFATRVARYISIRSRLEAASEVQMKKRLDNIYQNREPVSIVRRMTPYLSAVAAACLIFFFGGQFIFKKTSAQKIAKNYIGSYIQKAPTMMGKENYQDQLNAGKDAFFNNKYDSAEKIFITLVASDPANTEAQEYLGKVYLSKGMYEKAIFEFDSLSRNAAISVNYGKFYKAITLMRRSEKSDVEKAREILKDVVKHNLGGNREAKKWLNNF